jgi:hypothetical protein
MCFDADICITFTAARNVMKELKIKALGNLVFLYTPNLEICRLVFAMGDLLYHRRNLFVCLCFHYIM